MSNQIKKSGEANKKEGLRVEQTWRRTRPRGGRAEAERWPRSAATRRSRLPACSSSMGTAGGAREEGEVAAIGWEPRRVAFNRTPKQSKYIGF